MILKELIIYSVTEEKTIKNYIFNEYGLNIILGSKSEEGNGTGKTSMVESINYLLGSKIPKDFQNRGKLLDLNINLILKILDEKTRETVYLARSIREKNNGFILKESLNYDLNTWEKYKDKEYKDKIEELFMGKKENITLTFASIREYLIRNEKEGFTDIILARRKAIKSYEILSFLFDININAESKIKILKDSLESLEKEVKIIESMSDEIITIRIMEKKLNEEVEGLKIIATSLQLKDGLEAQKKEYELLKKELNQIDNQMIKLNNMREQYELNIENLKGNIVRIKKMDDVEAFYEHIISYFPQKIKKEKEEIQIYYEFMVNSRGKYFQKKSDEIFRYLSVLENDKMKIEKKLMKIMKVFKSTTLVEDINIIIEKINDKNQELADIRYKINQYSKIEKITKEINEIKELIIKTTNENYDYFKLYKENKDASSLLFNEITQRTYNEDGILEFTFINGTNKKDTTGRVKIQCKITDENSHGRRYMKINMFDISWLIERVRHNRSLALLIHDGSYVKPDDKAAKRNLIHYTDKILCENKRGQYFVTLNSDELNYEDIIYFKENHKVIAELGKNIDSDRFMGIKYI